MDRRQGRQPIRVPWPRVVDVRPLPVTVRDHPDIEHPSTSFRLIVIGPAVLPTNRRWMSPDRDVRLAVLRDRAACSSATVTTPVDALMANLPTCIVVQGVGDRVVGCIGVRRQCGYANHRAIGRVLVDLRWLPRWVTALDSSACSANRPVADLRQPTS